ncbi:MAG: SOS response-associated peptidase [Flavobacteriales bacterium]
MCYSAKSILRRELILALRNKASAEEIDDIIEELKKAEPENENYFIQAQTHPFLVVQTNEPGSNPQYLSWGLIPSDCRDEKSAEEIRRMTINARCETIFEKKSFRESAIHRRCIIAIDGFYEYMHQGKNKYPFFVQLKTGPMVLAGLWSEWVNPETGEILKTVTIVTTNANSLLQVIHNTKKRMPVILNEEGQKIWLENSTDYSQLFIPFDSNEFEVHSVKPLLGKNGTGNTPEASVEFEYPELVFVYSEINEIQGK